MFILGWVLVVLGFMFIVLGFVGAAIKVIASSSGKVRPDSVLGDLTEFIKALNEFLKTLGTSPAWLACVVIGALLDLAGFYVLKYAA